MNNFALELYEESCPQDRCPHLRVDQDSPYCGKDLDHNSDHVSLERRLISDHCSMQLWCCAGPERYEKCIWYKGEPFKNP